MEALRCTTQAARWGEAFPLGNGHMGAMIYGGIERDQVDLSENTFFSGCASDKNSQPGAADAFYTMRKQIAKGDYAGAHKEAESFIGVRHDYGTNLPVGKLWVDFLSTGEEVSAYQRTLSMEEGMTCVSYEVGENHIERKAWMSHAPNVFIYEVKAKQPVSCKISYEGYTEETQVQVMENRISFTEYAHETMHCDTACGVGLGGYLRVFTDGTVQAKQGHLVLEQVTEFTILLSMETDFRKSNLSVEDCVQLAANRVKHIAQAEIKNLWEQHKTENKKAMDACTLELNSGKQAETNLISRQFQYGRYLLWASSREDSKLPAHLQGVWNDNVACRIGWTCDMHLDINTQMNYWPADITGLPGVAKPLYHWVEKDLVNSGSKSAMENYNLQGWVAEIVSNAWAFSAPYWGVPIAPCPTGGVWILTHLWEHYLFTGDVDFLEKEAFMPIEEAARFFADYVFLQDGRYQCGPAISPENSFQIGTEVYQISNSCTYELTMIRELMGIYRKACEVLNRKEQALYSRAVDILERLEGFRILPDGTLAEWNHDYPAADPQHRHTSHLLGLFPFGQINVEDTPELCQAAKKALDAKLDPPEGWEDTGWARSMLMLYESRLQDGAASYGHIKSMLEHLLEPNGMIIHPPTRGAGSFAPVYELDGNTGLTSCIAEMLLQSQGEKIRILPAIPKEWEEGSVHGLHARGNIVVDITWNKDGTIEAVLCSPVAQTVLVVCGAETTEVYLKEKEAFQFSGCLHGQEE